jgi:hypothetical protein
MLCVSCAGVIRPGDWAVLEAGGGCRKGPIAPSGPEILPAGTPVARPRSRDSGMGPGGRKGDSRSGRRRPHGNGACRISRSGIGRGGSPRCGGRAPHPSQACRPRRRRSRRPAGQPADGVETSPACHEYIPRAAGKGRAPSPPRQAARPAFARAVTTVTLTSCRVPSGFSSPPAFLGTPVAFGSPYGGG